MGAFQWLKKLMKSHTVSFSERIRQVAFNFYSFSFRIPNPWPAAPWSLPSPSLPLCFFSFLPLYLYALLHSKGNARNNCLSMCWSRECLSNLEQREGPSVDRALEEQVGCQNPQVTVRLRVNKTQMKSSIYLKKTIPDFFILSICGIKLELSLPHYKNRHLSPKYPF